MTEKTIDTKLGKKLTKRTFILTIQLINIITLLPSIIFSIPGIISLLLYLQDKSLKHSFHKYFGFYTLIMCSIQIFSYSIAVAMQIISFFISFGGGIFFITVNIAFLMFVVFMLFVNVFYFFNVRRFLDIAKEDRQNRQFEKSLEI